MDRCIRLTHKSTGNLAAVFIELTDDEVMRYSKSYDIVPVIMMTQAEFDKAIEDAAREYSWVPLGNHPSDEPLYYPPQAPDPQNYKTEAAYLEALDKYNDFLAGN